MPASAPKYLAPLPKSPSQVLSRLAAKDTVEKTTTIARSSYRGEVRGGIRHGEGEFAGPGGFPHYRGQWCEGRRHGTGTLVYAKGGDVYEGEWADDARSGRGVLKHASGNWYEGWWASDRKNGQGTFHWLDRRERYTGQWLDGQPHGVGEHVWLRVQVDASPFQLRERYSGDWVRGVRQGTGTFFFANGARYLLAFLQAPFFLVVPVLLGLIAAILYAMSQQQHP